MLLLWGEEYFQLIYSVKKIRPSLTTIRRSENTEHTLIYNKDLTPECGVKFYLPSYGQGYWLFQRSTIQPDQN